MIAFASFYLPLCLQIPLPGQLLSLSIGLLPPLIKSICNFNINSYTTYFNLYYTPNNFGFSFPIIVL